MAIVGAGPAGLGLVLAIQQQAFAGKITEPLQIFIIEKQKVPIDKVCGEGIMANGVLALKHLFPPGHDEKFDDKKMASFIGIQYIDERFKNPISGHFPEGLSGLGIRRTCLSRMLWEQVQQNNSASKVSTVKAKIDVQILSETELEGIEILQKPSEKKVKLQLSSGDLLLVDYLVGADGIRSSVRHALHIKEKKLGSGKRIGVRAHFKRESAENASLVRVYFPAKPYTGIEAYVTPNANNEFEILFNWDHQRVHHHHSGDELFYEFLKFFPRLIADFGSENELRARQMSEAKTLGPLGHESDGPVHPSQRVFLLGDAFLFFDGITGEGLSLSFESAVLFAETCVRGHFSPVSIALYQKTMKKIAFRYKLITRLALLMTYFPRWRYWVLRLLEWRPQVFAFILRKNMGL